LRFGGLAFAIRFAWTNEHAAGCHRRRGDYPRADRHSITAGHAYARTNSDADRHAITDGRATAGGLEVV
jgi:hypothetical protein